MNKLIQIATQLLSEHKIAQCIGFSEGTRRPRPFFCKSADEAGKLILNEHCKQNLAAYATRQELLDKELPTAILANARIARSLLQLRKENQLPDGRFLYIIGEEADNCKLVEEDDPYPVLEAYANSFEPSTERSQEEKDIQKLSREERWKYWQEELTQCIRCYACRAACPLCYCQRCIVEVNCPQWIDPWAAPLSNMEWQINRVMHMAGRCTDCGACQEACPLDLPIRSLTRELNETVRTQLPEASTPGNALSTFNVHDTETFIR